MNFSEEQKRILLKYMKEHVDFDKGRLRYADENKRIMVSKILSQWIFIMLRLCYNHEIILRNNNNILFKKIINIKNIGSNVARDHDKIKFKWKWPAETAQRVE